VAYRPEIEQIYSKSIKNDFFICSICSDFARFLTAGDSFFRIASDSIFILSGLSARNLSNLFKI